MQWCLCGPSLAIILHQAGGHEAEATEQLMGASTGGDARGVYGVGKECEPEEVPLIPRQPSKGDSGAPRLASAAGHGWQELGQDRTLHPSP